MLEIPGQVWQRVKTGPLWRSLFRHGYPDSRKNQSLAVFTNVFLHLHPVKVRRHALGRNDGNAFPSHHGLHCLVVRMGRRGRRACRFVRGSFGVKNTSRWSLWRRYSELSR